MKLKINVTQEVIERSSKCGLLKKYESAPKNCAIAEALKHIFPNVKVSTKYIYPFDKQYSFQEEFYKIHLPEIAREFIKQFDYMTSSERLKLEPISFLIDVPESVINEIDITDIKKEDTVEVVNDA